MTRLLAILVLLVYPASVHAQNEDHRRAEHAEQHAEQHAEHDDEHDGDRYAEDKAAIKHVLVTAYVEGIHVNRDIEAVKSGFHPDFVMHVYSDDQLIKAPLSMWLDRLQLDGTRNPKTIEHQFDLVDVSGNTALAKMQIYADEEHIYTDYLGLYRFESGWQIVNKIFYAHP